MCSVGAASVQRQMHPIYAGLAQTSYNQNELFSTRNTDKVAWQSQHCCMTLGERCIMKPTIAIQESKHGYYDWRDLYNDAGYYRLGGYLNGGHPFVRFIPHSTTSINLLFFSLAIMPLTK